MADPLQWSLYDSTGKVRGEIGENEIGGILSTNIQENNPVHFISEDPNNTYRIEVLMND